MSDLFRNRSMGSSRTQYCTRALSAAITACGFAAPAFAVDVTVNISTTPIGVTPRYIGFNMGHYLPNSNTTGWLQYSGANAYRVWASANDYEGSDDLAPYGDGVQTQQDFETRKGLVRANPESPLYTNWAQFNDRFANMTQSGRNHVRLNHILGELQRSGVEPILNLTRTESYSYSGWGGKWEQWQFAYAMAYHAAKNYDVQRFQWYNEPDQNNSTITIDEYADRLRVTSDAIRSVVEDVNRIYGKSLVFDMSAPTTKDGASKVETWGKPILQANRTDYAGNVSPVDIFNTYDLHRYNSTGAGFSSDLSSLAVKIPQYNATGAMMPVTYTEFNRYNTSTFSNRSDSLDTPQVFAEYAGVYNGAMSGNVKGMYAFKFSQTVWTDPGFPEPMKTGHYYVEDFGDNNITGATQGAEVARLITKAFKNQRPRLNAGMLIPPSGTSFTASVDSARGDYHFLTANPSTTAMSATMNLTPWAIEPGHVIAVQEVSGVHHGSVSQFITVPENRVLQFTQPAQSVLLLSFPQGAAQTQVDLPATADAQVNNQNKNANYGLLTTANVARAATNTNDQATYLKFNLGGNNKANINRAYLRLTGSNIANSDLTTLHVYGITNDALDAWNELTINWNNAPGLSGAADARLAGVGTNFIPVGQLTWDDNASEWGIDVTDFVRSPTNSDLSLVVIREERFLGDADTSRIQISTREALSGQPRLSLFTSDTAMHIWKNNFNNSAFGTSGNWDVGAPNAAGAVAVLGDFITAARVITTNASTTVGELRFDNTNRYILSGTGTLTLDGGGGASSAIRVFKGDHVIFTPTHLATPTTIQTDANTSLTFGNHRISGSAPLTKTGAGTLVVGNHNTSFSGGITINEGTVRVVTSDSNFVSGLGTGPVVVNTATLRMENVSVGGTGKPGPDLTLNNGASLLAIGTSQFSKSGSPMIANGTSGSPVTVNISTASPGDSLTLLTALRNVASAPSSALISVNGPGRVVLRSGGLSSSATYSGGWLVSGGSLQLGPTASSSSESLNALGFKNGDAKQGNSIFVSGGAILIGAENTPQDPLVTPDFLRANVTLSGGKLASSGVDAKWGGNFATGSSALSTVLVYDPLTPTAARDVNLVAGAAGPLNNAASTSWAGTLQVSAGSLASGGSFNINRSGGTINVVPNALIHIDPGAHITLGGVADALSDGTRHVNIVNHSAAGLHVTAGTKNIGTLSGEGSTSIAAGVTLIADHVRQSSMTIAGALCVRDNGTSTGTSDLNTVQIAPAARFDLRDNDLVLREMSLDDATALIAAGRGDGSWNGSGLVTSMSDATSGVLTTLAVAMAADIGATSLWSGRTIESNDVLVAYTWGGDADLDGDLDGDDYFRIDSSVAQSGTVSGFHNGDFDYDGDIDGDDYFIIDSNIAAAQSSSRPGGVVAVPEPACFSLLAMLCPLLPRRRRRG